MPTNRFGSTLLAAGAGPRRLGPILLVMAAFAAVPAVAAVRHGWQFKDNDSYANRTYTHCGSSKYGIYLERVVYKRRHLVVVAKVPLLGDHQWHNAQFQSASGSDWERYSKTQRYWFAYGIDQGAYKVISLNGNAMTLQGRYGRLTAPPRNETLHRVRC